MTNTITIDQSNADQRLDRFLRKFFKNEKTIKLWDIYAGVRKGEVKVNDRKTKEEYRLKLWDIIKIEKLENKSPVTNKSDLLDMEWFKNTVIFEDDNWLAVDKPSNMVMHTNDPKDIAIQDYVDEYCKDLVSQTFRPSFGYRLDKDTTWVLIAAKTYPALQFINKIIRDRDISKQYIAIVVWEFPKHIVIDKKLEKQFNEKFKRGQTVVNERYWEKAISECRNEKTIDHDILGKISLIKVKIQTGKMHQIRVHTASIWYPVLWDIVYWNPATNRILFKNLWVKRQLLHAREYSFFDIFSHKKIDIKAPTPDDFKVVLEKYAR
jgi:23S rRNA pseudouridine955/2504/2580 synthase